MLLIAALTGIGAASAPNNLRYGGPTSWTVTGPEGGPFSSTGYDAVLGNKSTQPLSWSATSVPSFVQLPHITGVIQPHTRVHLTVSLNAAVAQAITAGNYTEMLTFHNDTTPETDINVTCTLSVQSLPSSSQLVPATDFASQGPAAGPFVPDSKLYSLTNTGSTALSWQASAPDAWVLIAPASGQLSPGASVDVRASIDDPATMSMTIGVHQSVVEWRDAASSAVLHSRNVNLNVIAGSSSSQLLPATNFASQGAASGPFVPDGTVYSLTNMGNTALSWQAGAADAWVSISPASGQLLPAASVNVSVSINDPATVSLSNGTHHSVVEWRDAASSAVLHSRSVDLNVLPSSPSVGWTVFTPSADTRTIYVSSSTGNDANDGLSTSTPKRTIAAGKALLRNGFPDWLLLATGDTWNEALGGWGLNGRSNTERMLVSSYGSGIRPLLQTGIGSGFSTGSSGNNTAIVGLRFWANAWNGTNVQWGPRAIEMYGSVHNFLLEDCYLQAYSTNMVVQGADEYPGNPANRHSNIVIRRNVIVDAYSGDQNGGGENSQGIFLSGSDGVVLEENVWDHNGWGPNGSVPTWYRRNIYIQNLNTGVIVRGNIIASTEGIQQRSGGICDDNLFLHNAISIGFGLGGYPEIEANGVTGSVCRNVILDGGDLQAGSPRGWGMWLGNISQATVDSNVIAHNVSGHGPSPVTFEVAVNGRGVENTMFSNNVVYAWNGYSRFKGNAAQTLNFQLLNNKFQNEITAEVLLQHDQSGSASSITSANNTFHDLNAAPGAWMQAGTNLSLDQWKALVHDTTSIAQQVPFPDPTRTIATYHASIGGAPTLEAFMAEARKQSKSNWRVQYTAQAVNEYIRAGFGFVPQGFSP